MKLIKLKYVKIFSNGSLNFFYTNSLKSNLFLKNDYINFFFNKKKIYSHSSKKDGYKKEYI